MDFIINVAKLLIALPCEYFVRDLFDNIHHYFSMGTISMDTRNLLRLGGGFGTEFGRVGYMVEGGVLIYWGRVTHMCVGKSTIIGSDNGLAPVRRQAIIWTNDGILLIEHLGTYFSQILIGIQIFSFTKMRLKMSSGKWRSFCLGLNVLKALMSSWI